MLSAGRVKRKAIQNVPIRIIMKELHTRWLHKTQECNAQRWPCEKESHSECAHSHYYERASHTLAAQNSLTPLHITFSV